MKGTPRRWASSSPIVLLPEPCMPMMMIGGMERDRVECDSTGQPFVAPAVRPATMYFWVKRAITMIGTVTTTEADIRPPQSMLAYDTKLKIATGSVLVFAPASTRANMKLFHEKMNDRMPAVARPGADSGSVTRMKAPIGVSPSTCAASSSSVGRESKNDIMTVSYTHLRAHE